MAVTGRRRRDSIDWKAVRARMARAIAATERSFAPSPEQARRIMDERARALARPLEADRPSEPELDVLVFGLGRERYAVETRYTLKLLRVDDLTPVPGTPDFVRGIVSLHGEMLAVIDLGSFFGHSGPAPTDLSRLIVLGEEQAEFGVLADDLHEVTGLSTEQVLAPPTEAGPAPAYVRGVTHDALILLDGAVLLEDRRLFVEQRDQPLTHFGATA